MKALILGVMEIFMCSIILYGWYFKCLMKKEPLLKLFDGAEDVVLKLLAGGILVSWYCCSDPCNKGWRQISCSISAEFKVWSFDRKEWRNYRNED